MSTHTKPKPKQPPARAGAPPARTPKPPAKRRPASGGSYDYQAAITSLPEDLRTETLQLSAAIDQLKEDDIRKRVELGRRLVAIRDDTTGRYGDDPLRQIANVMPLSKDGLRPMIVLAECYSDAEIGQLLAFRHPVTQERLTWTHVIGLTRVKDKAKALRLAEQTVAEGWTSRDLNRKIIQAHGGPKSKGGRKAKKLTSFLDAVADVTARTATWENASDNVWLAPGGLVDLYESAASVPGFRPDPATVAALDALTTRLMGTALKLAGLTQQVNALKHRVDAARNAHPVV